MSIQKLRDDFCLYRQKLGKIKRQKEAFEKLAEAEKKCGKRFELEWNEDTLALNDEGEIHQIKDII